MNGAQGEEKLKAEIKRLLAEIEQLQIKTRKEYQEMEVKLNKQRENELKAQHENNQKTIKEL